MGACGILAFSVLFILASTMSAARSVWASESVDRKPAIIRQEEIQKFENAETGYGDFDLQKDESYSADPAVVPMDSGGEQSHDEAALSEIIRDGT